MARGRRPPARSRRSLLHCIALNLGEARPLAAGPVHKFIFALSRLEPRRGATASQFPNFPPRQLPNFPTSQLLNFPPSPLFERERESMACVIRMFLCCLLGCQALSLGLAYGEYHGTQHALHRMRMGRPKQARLSPRAPDRRVRRCIRYGALGGASPPRGSAVAALTTDATDTPIAQPVRV